MLVRLNRLFLLSVAVLALFGSCKKEDEGESGNAKYSMTFTKGNKLIEIREGKDSFRSAPFTGLDGDKAIVGAMFLKGADIGNTEQAVVWNAVTPINWDYWVPADIEKASKLGDYVYRQDYEEEGAEFAYMDENLVYWSSFNGPQDKDSYFRIVEKEEDQTGRAYYYVKVEFNCLVYDEDGNKERVKNGVYKGFWAQ